MAQRVTDYIILPPVGTDRLKTRGTVADLVIDIPFLLFSDYIPPLYILNEVLMTGRKDAGMSGGAEWEPFEITEEGYTKLVSELQVFPGRKFHYYPPPAQITRFEQWVKWVLTQPKR